MNKLKDFLIAFSGLKEGKHSFNLKVNDTFFSCFDYSEIKKGDISVFVQLIKHSTFLEFEITTTGYVEVMCDKCSDKFNLSIEGDRKVIVKFGDKFNDEDSDIITVQPSENQIDISHLVYENIMLSIPTKRIHPKGDCNEEVIKMLEELRIEEEIEETTDPRWDALKKLK